MGIVWKSTEVVQQGFIVQSGQVIKGILALTKQTEASVSHSISEFQLCLFHWAVVCKKHQLQIVELFIFPPHLGGWFPFTFKVQSSHYIVFSHVKEQSSWDFRYCELSNSAFLSIQKPRYYIWIPWKKKKKSFAKWKKGSINF